MSFSTADLGLNRGSNSPDRDIQYKIYENIRNKHEKKGKIVDFSVRSNLLHLVIPKMNIFTRG